MQPWWSESASTWIGALGGAGCGVVFGVYGSLAGSLAPKGIGRRWVLPIHALFVVLAVTIGVAGVVGAATGQPGRVWYPMVLVGGIGTLVMLPLFFVIRIRYRQAEMRKVDAAEFRS